MSGTPSEQRRARLRALALVLARAAGAGAVLAAIEIALVLVRSRGLFLSPDELVRFALAALAVVTAATAAASVLGAGVARRLAPGGVTDEPRVRRRLAWTATLCALPLLAWTSWLLTEGPRVRDLSWRPALVAALAITAAGT